MIATMTSLRKWAPNSALPGLCSRAPPYVPGIPPGSFGIVDIVVLLSAQNLPGERFSGGRKAPALSRTAQRDERRADRARVPAAPAAARPPQPDAGTATRARRE